MRVKLTLVIILMVFLIASASHFIVLAANDAPHNASNNMNCGSCCHGAALQFTILGHRHLQPALP